MNNFYIASFSLDGDYLSHHGIKGQKWGEKNGPPYPLDRITHNRVVKKISDSIKKKQEAALRKNKKNFNEAYEEWDKKGVYSSKFLKAYGINDTGLDTVKNIPKGTLETYKKSYEKYLKDEKTRLSYKEKTLKGKKLDKDEEALRRKDAIIKCAVAGALIIGATYYIKKNGSLAQVAIPKDPFLSDKNLLKQLSDQDIVLEAGRKFYRQQPIGELDLTNPHMYVAVNDFDKKLYREFLGAGLKGANKHYEVIMQAQKDIKAPSVKKMAEIMTDMMNEDDEFLEYMYRLYSPTDMVRAPGISKPYYNTKELFKEFVNKDELTKRIALRGINWSIVKEGEAGYENTSKYMNKIRDLGYNAVLDLNDSGDFTTQPMILLDAKNDVVQTGKKRITALTKELTYLQMPFNIIGKTKKDAEKLLFEK